MWIAGVLWRTIVVTLIAYGAWFGGVMTGVVRLGWLVRLVGTPKLERPWDTIALFGPAVAVGTVYFLYELSRPREAIR